jgi:GT2 family glycosyltransferase
VPVEVLLELGRVCRAEPLTMVSPRLVDPLGGPHFHGSELDLSTGRIRGLHPARRTAQGWSLGASRVEGTGVPWLTGACLAMHRRLFTLIGGLDERYFLYWEDVDLSFRARRHGATLAVRPDLVGRHDAGGTQGARRGRAKSARYYYFNARNRLRFAARHLPRRQLLRWLASTPRVSLEILLQGGRRQLLRSPVPLLAVTAGAAAGVIHAVRTLPARPRPPAGPPAPAVVRQPVRVTVAMLTFHRADDLAAAVPLLLAQREEVTDPTTEVDVLVVDNDPAGRGAAMVRALQHPHMRAVVEPTPGIPAARNRALDECADRDVLVFIDDDERPHEGWLRHLLDTYRSTGADAVAGPVVSRFSGTLDPWVAAGAFFRRRRLPTGSPIDVAATNNLLLDMAAVRRTGARFDVRFGLVGVGEDTLFTRSMAQQGARLLWCDEAIVTG